MEAAWLKSVFHETEYISDSPHPKRMKFSDISAELHSHFPQRKYTTNEVSRLVRETFPSTESKPCGKSRQKQILGLERIPTMSMGQSEPSTALVSQCSISDASQTPSYSDLLIENQRLKARIQELERTSTSSLCCQADEVICHKSAVSQGPNSLSTFYELDFDSIVSELKSRAPDLYHFYMALGDTSRNQVKDEVTTEEVKAVASMCSLLNARSARMKGLQLLVSMMLVARATSKQVLSVIYVGKIMTTLIINYRPLLC